MRTKRIRDLILEAIYHAGSGHPGGSLSCVEILTWLHFHHMGKDDVFILSKGHAAPALYAVWVEQGKMTEEELMDLRRLGAKAQGHPSFNHTPECITSTGSLGQGLATGVGIAMGKALTGQPGRVFVLIGDGEMQEGIVWESLLIAAHHRLGNLVIILDYNKMQSDAFNGDISNIEPVDGKVRAFGCEVRIIDGHSMDSLEDIALPSRQPIFAIAHTVKGYGVAYMAGDPAWHGSVVLTKDQLREGLQ